MSLMSLRHIGHFATASRLTRALAQPTHMHTCPQSYMAAFAVLEQQMAHSPAEVFSSDASLTLLLQGWEGSEESSLTSELDLLSSANRLIPPDRGRWTPVETWPCEGLIFPDDEFSSSDTWFITTRKRKVLKKLPRFGRRLRRGRTPS